MTDKTNNPSNDNNSLPSVAGSVLFPSRVDTVLNDTLFKLYEEGDCKMDKYSEALPLYNAVGQDISKYRKALPLYNEVKQDISKYLEALPLYNEVKQDISKYLEALPLYDEVGRDIDEYRKALSLYNAVGQDISKYQRALPLYDEVKQDINKYYAGMLSYNEVGQDLDKYRKASSLYSEVRQDLDKYLKALPLYNEVWMDIVKYRKALPLYNEVKQDIDEYRKALPLYNAVGRDIDEYRKALPLYNAVGRDIGRYRAALSANELLKELETNVRKDLSEAGNSQRYLEESESIVSMLSTIHYGDITKVLAELTFLPNCPESVKALSKATAAAYTTTTTIADLEKIMREKVAHEKGRFEAKEGTIVMCRTPVIRAIETFLESSEANRDLFYNNEAVRKAIYKYPERERDVEIICKLFRICKPFRRYYIKINEESLSVALAFGNVDNLADNFVAILPSLPMGSLPYVTKYASTSLFTRPELPQQPYASTSLFTRPELPQQPAVSSIPTTTPPPVAEMHHLSVSSSLLFPLLPRKLIIVSTITYKEEKTEITCKEEKTEKMGRVFKVKNKDAGIKLFTPSTEIKGPESSPQLSVSSSLFFNSKWTDETEDIENPKSPVVKSNIKADVNVDVKADEATSPPNPQSLGR